MNCEIVEMHLPRDMAKSMPCGVKHWCKTHNKKEADCVRDALAAEKAAHAETKKKLEELQRKTGASS